MLISLEDLEGLHVHDGQLHLGYETTQGGVAAVLVPASDLIEGSSTSDLSTLSSEGAYKSCAYRMFLRLVYVCSDIGSPKKLTLPFWVSPETHHLFNFVPPSFSIMLRYQNESGAVCLFNFEDMDYYSLYRFHADTVPPTCAEHHLFLPTVLHPRFWFPARIQVLVDEHLGIIYVCSREDISAVFYT